MKARYNKEQQKNTRKLLHNSGIPYKEMCKKHPDLLTGDILDDGLALFCVDKSIIDDINEIGSNFLISGSFALYMYFIQEGVCFKRTWKPSDIDIFDINSNCDIERHLSKKYRTFYESQPSMYETSNIKDIFYAKTNCHSIKINIISLDSPKSPAQYIFDEFDNTACMAYYCFESKQFKHHYPKATKALKFASLRSQRNINRRIYKYMSRGFELVPFDTFSKAAYSFLDLDPNSVPIIKDLMDIIFIYANLRYLYKHDDINELQKNALLYQSKI